MAPHVVAQALKTASLAAYIFSSLGCRTEPSADAPRSDIIQLLHLGSAEKLCAFCRGIQKGSAVDSFVTPEPYAMPGYSDSVIMAAGAFTQGFDRAVGRRSGKASVHRVSSGRAYIRERTIRYSHRSPIFYRRVTFSFNCAEKFQGLPLLIKINSGRPSS